MYSNIQHLFSYGLSSTVTRFEVSTDDLNTNTPQEEGESVPQVFDDSQLNPVEMVDELSAKKSAALLLLNLKERHRLTQSAVNFTVGQIKQNYDGICF